MNELALTASPWVFLRLSRKGMKGHVAERFLSL